MFAKRVITSLPKNTRSYFRSLPDEFFKLDESRQRDAFKYLMANKHHEDEQILKFKIGCAAVATVLGAGYWYSRKVKQSPETPNVPASSKVPK